MPHFDRNKAKLNWSIDFAAVLLFCACGSISLLFTIYSFYNPRDAISIGQLISEQYYSYFLFGIPLAVLHGYMVAVIEFAVAFVGIGTMSFLFYLTVLIQGLHLQPKNVYRTINLIRRPYNLRIFYRSLQYLNENAMCFIGPYLAVVHAIVSIYFEFVQVVFIEF